MSNAPTHHPNKQTTRMNGSGAHKPCPAAKPDADKRVYACGNCDEQGHRLLPENEIICGNCSAPSAFVWIEPEKKRADDAKRRPRLKRSLKDMLDNLVCRKCSFNNFHLHQSGTLTCYRCRHAVSYVWINPMVGREE